MYENIILLSENVWDKNLKGTVFDKWIWNISKRYIKPLQSNQTDNTVIETENDQRTNKLKSNKHKKRKKKTITGQQEQNIEHISLFRGRLDMFYTVQL